MPSSRFSGDFTYKVFVPLLMCTVAAVQIFLVENHSLSRWKGGGFGMFTTVDSPSSRFLRIYLSSSEGEIPVLVPKDLRKLAHKVRVMPTESRLRKLVEAINLGRWHYLSMISASEHYIELLRDAGPGYQDMADEIQYKNSASTAQISFENLQMVKMLGKDEKPSTDKKVQVLGARVEVWKYSFNKGELALKASKLAVASSGNKTND